MAATKGTSVLIKVSTTTIGLTDNVSMSVTVGNEEITSFGDTWKAMLPTIKEWGLSVSGTYDKSDSGQDTAFWTEVLSGDGAIADVRFYTGATTYWSGAACIESVSIDATATGKIAYSASLKGNGTLSYTS